MVELGIVLGVIVILVGVVLTAKGHADNAKAQSTATMVRTLQEIAPVWSERFRRGKGFAGGGLQPLTNNNVSISGLLPKVGTNTSATAVIETGWGSPMTIRATPTSAAGGIYYDYEIVFCTPSAVSGDDLQKMLQGRGVIVRPSLSDPLSASDRATHRCPTGCATCLFRVQSGSAD